MITQLLVLFCVCACVVADNAAPAPPYLQHLTAMYTEGEIVVEEVLPLLDDIPYLDSPQRHFAAILYFINTAARARSGCVVTKYNEEYVKLVNSSALEGFANPQAAVDELADLMTTLQQKLKKIVYLIEDTDPDMEDNKRNALVDQRIKADLASYETPAAMFIAAGEAAMKAEDLNKEIYRAAYDLSALKFIINGADKLREIIEATAALHRALNGFRQC
ncbi:uncharacterized protein LOC124643804 [Helicoverpa zea]|uniref:uncharacterized protein LOC124643804 n=1 Tax=Helicoverpa zea TaxID=7113 RepID=UPI001F5849B2|nr:uncharacterized protein LOC124643804 [Helicoverpa zea]